MDVAAFGSIGYRMTSPDFARLDAIITLGFTILVSDADGADTQIQQHLAARAYRRVVLYHNGVRQGGPRRNLGGWPTVLVRGSFTDKDARMCADAGSGLAFWNGRSKGTGRNIAQLRRDGKKVRVVSPCAPQAATVENDSLFAALMEDAEGIA
jgi:hypothetical protein